LDVTQKCELRKVIQVVEEIKAVDLLSKEDQDILK
jgi:hypothetical protein